jgi:phosphoglycerol transferase MdoB-like AlkP superfamily enzyme
MKYLKKVLKLIYNNKKAIPVYLLSAYSFFVFTIYLKQEQFTGARLLTALGYLFICTAVLSACLLPANSVRKWTKKYAIWINGILLLLSPVVSFIMVETMVGNYNLGMFKAYGLYNLIWYIVVYYMIFALIIDVKLTIQICSIVIYFASMVNYLVYMFRGNPILPSDLLAWRTGMSVAGNYQLSFTKEFLASTLIMIAMYAAAHMLEGKVRKPLLRYRLTAIGSYVVFILVVFHWFFDTDLVKSKIRVIDFFAPRYTYCSYGTVFGFVANVEAMDTEGPEGYSKEKAEKLLASVKEKDEGNVTPDKEKPDVIVIMNEAFSDLSLVGDYKTNIDYLPNIRALKEDTIKGELYVSVFGGATSDTEYEFLTGNSMAVMPPNCVPYQQFVTEPTDSLAATLKEQGYYNIAIHPYKPSGYKRDLVYPLLGFDEFLSEDDFTNPHTIRSFISDRDSYSKIIEEYEANKGKGPLFFFNVTMQNHGGYSSDQLFSDEETVRLEEYPGFLYVDQYLSLLRESDKAFMDLINYFKKQERPAIIVIFGDHQPIAYSGLYDIMSDRDKADQLKYKVPFVIWANYDIAEEDVGAMSANYLSSYLLRTAGLKGTVYNNYLMQLYNKIPVINALFYMDNDNKLYSLTDDTPYRDAVNGYKYIGYNNALDKRNKLKEYFYLKQEVK